MIRGLRVLSFLFFSFLFGPLLQAGYDYKFEQRETTMGQFESEMSAKAVRGLTNVMYGWTELARTPVEWEARTEHGVLSALIVGIPYGVVRMVGRTLVGVYEMATFYAPQKPIFKELEGDVL